jgi:methylenetetrahydrofolate reductase (NADPH)
VSAISRLEQILDAGGFAVTAELGPPKGSDVEIVRRKAEYLKGVVDAVNVTDNQTAVVRMSSIATCAILRELEIEPVMQMVCRDRNRIALQSDILGAYALGIHNVLCLSGDHQRFGNHPEAKNVFDLDSVQLIQAARAMRDENKFISGDEVEGALSMFIGAAANPFADPFEFRVRRLAKKVDAGAQFIQTQCVYDLEKFRKWMEMVRDVGLHERVHILAGITPLKSDGMARYMRDHVAGIDVPDELIRRLRSAGKGKAADEGISVAVETIEEMRDVEGVHGVHLMAIEWERKVPEIVERAGLSSRKGGDT